MSETIDLTLTDMANGGAALGRDEQSRVVFVPQAIPGERVQVEIVADKGRYAQGRLVTVLDPADERISPRCPHFELCGGCAFQHIRYPDQLRYKQAVVQDQLKRIGGLLETPVRPVLPHPEPWHYRTQITFSPTDEGDLGFWSPVEKRVIPIQECPVIRPELEALFQDVDLRLPGLRSLTLRRGDDGALLVALAVDDVEPPELNTDFAVAVAMVLPNGQAANLVGDNYIIQAVKGRDFRVSAGCYFYPSPPMITRLVDVVLGYAQLTGRETIIDAYCGVGTITAFLTSQAAMTQAIDVNPDAIADAALNLDEGDDVALYEGWVEEVLPMLAPKPDLLIVDPPADGLSREAVAAILANRPERLIYISEDIATCARDSRQLHKGGYALEEVQPLDMVPQAHQILTVSYWTNQS
jgi:23S rRNA (uracil1939-C5)-methyltransferase